MTAGARYVLRAVRGARLGDIAPGQTEVYLDLDASGSPVLAATNNGSRHARILVRIGRFSLEDLGGKAGTWLGEERLVARTIHELKPDVPFRLGASGTPLVLAKEEGPPPAHDPVARHELPAVTPVPNEVAHKPRRVQATPRPVPHREEAPPPLPEEVSRPYAKDVAGAFSRFEKSIAAAGQLPRPDDPVEIPALAPPKLRAAAGNAAAPGTVPNHLAQALMVTFLCCLPAGLVALVFSTRVNARLADGDPAGAWEASRNARTWVRVGTWAAIAFWAFVMFNR